MHLCKLILMQIRQFTLKYIFLYYLFIYLRVSIITDTSIQRATFGGEVSTAPDAPGSAGRCFASSLQVCRAMPKYPAFTGCREFNQAVRILLLPRWQREQCSSGRSRKKAGFWSLSLPQAHLIYSELTKEEIFLGTDCSKGTCNEQHSRYFSPDVRVPSCCWMHCTLFAVPS